MPRRGGVLDIDIHRAVRVCYEAGAIADEASIERIRHEAFFRVSHGQRPERVVGREPFRREVHDVIVLSGERVARAIYVRPPVHRLLRHVYRAGKYSGVRGPREHAVARQATPERGDPAIDSRNLDPRENLNRDKRQPEPDEEALY